jgi:type II restriction enzyme
MTTANKGEWAELYTILKLVLDGHFYGADNFLKPIDELKYIIKEVSSANGFTTFNLEADTKISVCHKGMTEEINRSLIEAVKSDILKAILEKSDTTFSINSANDFSDKYFSGGIKSSSHIKGDIKLTLKDPNTDTIVTDFFSVKSFLSGKPTLLNASGQTKIRYQIEKITEEQAMAINKIITISGSIDVTKRLRAIRAIESKIYYESYKSPVFESNLKEIDPLFPKFLADSLLDAYMNGGKNLSGHQNSQIMTNSELKTGQFLETILKGMMPSIKWDFSNIANGLLVVVPSGDILGFYEHNNPELIKFLSGDSYFDTPSTSRHEFGTIYNENDAYYIDLCMQIRLK